MPPRSFSDRSPVCVTHFDGGYLDSSASSFNHQLSNKQQQRTTKAYKSLAFAQDNQVFEIPHINDFTDDEIAVTWYDAAEYAAIKADYQCVIFIMESGEQQQRIEDDQQQTTRGLEYRTQQGAWDRYENKRDAYNAVLDEQDRHWKKDVDDPDAIRRVYVEQVAKCQTAAQDRAAQDEAFVKEMIRAESRRCSDQQQNKKKKSSSSHPNMKPKPVKMKDGDGVQKQLKSHKTKRQTV